MLKSVTHFENIFKKSAENCKKKHVEIFSMSKFQGVLKMFMLGMLKTMLKTVLKYEKTTITLDGVY